MLVCGPFDPSVTISRTPERPSINAENIVSGSLPSGEMTPSPVTTTRLVVKQADIDTRQHRQECLCHSGRVFRAEVSVFARQGRCNVAQTLLSVLSGLLASPRHKQNRRSR